MTKKIIAITSCPVGVAHTYMAAENLEKAGKEMGIDLKVETHGSIGIENAFTQADIDDAYGIIIAADTEIDKSRFVGKQIIEAGVKEGISRPQELIQEILDNKGKTLSSSETKAKTDANKGKTGNPVYRSLMNGVSYMVPFVVTGGLLIAIALTLGGTPTEAGLVVEDGTFWASILAIGGAAMGFMNPILAGYIAYGIADRPGLVPGMIGGFIAANGSFYGSEANTGFLGAIIAGFLAGYIALGIKRLPVPKALDSVMPIIFIPILSSVAVGLLFSLVIGAPVAGLFTALTTWLAGMQGASSIVLAIILGAMIAVDMGGPFNKTAFLFGAGLIGGGTYTVMGAVAVAICIPPIAVGIAAHLYKNKFSEADRQAGTAATIMGLFGITEGAIPFAAKDPLAVIPSIVVGSATGSVIAMLTGVGDRVAHGGPIVAILGAVDNVPMFFIAVAIGVAVTVALIGVLKKDITLEMVAASGDTTVSTDQAETEATPADTTAEEATLVSLTGKEFYHLDLQSDQKDGVFVELLNNSHLANRIMDKEAVLAAVRKRESEGSTGMGEGIAIPHAKSNQIKVPTVLFGRSQKGVEWDSLDGEPAHVVFLILVPEEHKGDLHLRILQMLARKLMDAEFKQALLTATTKEEIQTILETVK